MALVFKAFQSSIANKEGVKQWYPRVITVGKTVGTRQLATDVAEMSTMTPGDMYNALHALASVMKRYLQESHSVKLDGIGTFSLCSHASGRGVDTEKAVNSSQIARVSCRFVPEMTKNIDGTVATRALVQGVTFVSLSSLMGNDSTGSSDAGDDNTGDADSGSGGSGTGGNPL